MQEGMQKVIEGKGMQKSDKKKISDNSIIKAVTRVTSSK
jgi:hypothetical protein